MNVQISHLHISMSCFRQIAFFLTLSRDSWELKLWMREMNSRYFYATAYFWGIEHFWVGYCKKRQKELNSTKNPRTETISLLHNFGYGGNCDEEQDIIIFFFAFILFSALNPASKTQKSGQYF